VQVDQRRERTLAAWLEHTREQRLVAVTEILDILHIEFVGLGVDGLGVHGGHSLKWREDAIFAQTADRHNRADAVPGRSGHVVFPQQNA
jgi:hypothetical protein